MSSAVLDASALLAYLHDEEGAGEVEEALAHGASLSAANWAEVLSKVADEGGDPERLVEHLEQQGLLHGGLDVVPLAEEDAIRVVRLRPATRQRGLSLGDRACLALGQRLGLPVLTADRAWEGLGVGVEVRVIR